MNLNFVHLFPDLMNIYGDYGNVLAMQKRCEWRDINFVYQTVNSASDFNKINNADFIFWGGGQDKEQMEVSKIIFTTNEFKNALEQKVGNCVMLLVCGGYQMMGDEFIDSHGNNIKGLGLIPVKTRALNARLESRCIGNVVVEPQIPIEPKYLVGFENHGGQTIINKGFKDQFLGRVLHGFGNNSLEKQEGLFYKNIFATYMHGSLLPKNPHFADYLLKQTLELKYKNQITLKKLDDELEFKANSFIVKKYL